ncbi:MAG: aldehyde dehydrogenase family protein [Bacteroidota bacterium]
MNAQSTTHPLVPQTTAAEIQRLFELQTANQYRVAAQTAKERRAKIKALQRAVEKTYRKEIHAAAYADYRKSAAEVDATEVYGVVSDCRFALSNLGHWMRRKPVGTPLPLLGSKSYIHYEPKGVVLIISPWNFPLLLTFGPLISAIAAGNCVILKPSEMTPNMSALMKRIIGELFDESEVALIEGSIPETTALLELPFNHIFFTGSPQVGKIVMAAAAKHLCSVTLELGGKSPTIIDQSANLNAAAERVAWAKFLNNGQICIAPDYVLIHESRKEEFIAKVKKKVEEFYGGNVKQSPDYCRIVNDRHYRRIKSYVEDALDKNAVVAMGGELDDTENYIEPTVLTNISMDSRIMEEEIFGPVLPILTFKNREEVIEIINAKEKPLALYIYSSKKKNIQYFLHNTRAGGTVINHSTIHFNNHHLPFGGVNNSGIGKGHGYRGFEAFSNERGVLQQVFPFSSIKLFMPPYNRFTRWVIDFAVKWL